MGLGGLDKLFGGKPGDAQRTLDGYKRTYGAKHGRTVFDATVIKRQRKKPRGRKR